MPDDPKRRGPTRAAELTELEGCVLGVVWDQGPCTAYSIRRVFASSPSPHWTGSAGAIYPLVRRLRTRGLLESGDHPAGPDRGQTCRLTPRGRRALRSWLAPPFPDWAVGVPVDPLRTRLRFLAALSPAGRARFLGEAERKLREHIAEVRRDYRRRLAESDRFDWLMARGALRMLRARLDWLREVSLELKKDPNHR